MGHPALALGAILLSAGSAAEPAELPGGKVRIGVLASRETGQGLRRWGPTVEYLSREVPPFTFETVPLAYDQVPGAVARREVEFVFTNPGSYVELEAAHGTTGLLAVLHLRQGKAFKVHGGVIFTRADRQDLRTLEDLRGKSFMAVSEDSFGGWLAAWRELQAEGLDPRRDFRALLFAQDVPDAVVYAVGAGKVDAGTVRAGQLEAMAAAGRIDMRSFRILEPRPPSPEFPFAASTRLYPDWVLASLNHTAEDLVRRVTIALLRLAPDSLPARAAGCAGWTIPLSYEEVHQCLKELRAGPYRDHGKVTLAQAVRVLRYGLTGLGVTLLALAGVCAYFLRLNRSLTTAEQLLRTKNDLLESSVRSEREAHLALKQAQAQLIQSEKLASLGQLVAGVAHEINNPLAFVTNNLVVLQRDVRALRDCLELYGQAEALLRREAAELEGRIRVMQDRVDLPYTLRNLDDLFLRTREGLKRITAIVKDLRDFARLDQGGLHEVDLNEGIRSTVNILHHLVEKKDLRLELDLAPLPGVACYPAKINQVVMNLLSNAIDACARGGKVVVRSRLVGRRAEISVIDDGCGIDASIRDRIFDPFFTTKPPGKGTGLGLSISYGIVEEHGGSIAFESTPGKGSTFRVLLPLKPAASFRTTQARKRAAEAGSPAGATNPPDAEGLCATAGGATTGAPGAPDAPR